MKYYSIGEVADLIGKTSQTLRDWHKKELNQRDIRLYF